MLLAYYSKIDFNFRSLANGNCMYSSMPLLLVRNNSLMDELRCLTSTVLYFHSEFYGKHYCFESAELSQGDCFKTSNLFRSMEDCPCHRDERNHYWFSFIKSRDMLMTLIDETVIYLVWQDFTFHCGYKLCGYLYIQYIISLLVEY